MMIKLINKKKLKRILKLTQNVKNVNIVIKLLLII
jgi:hypothetical protein